MALKIRLGHLLNLQFGWYHWDVRLCTVHENIRDSVVIIEPAPLNFGILRQ